MGSDNNNNFKQPEVFPRTSEIWNKKINAAKNSTIDFIALL